MRPALALAVLLAVPAAGAAAQEASVRTYPVMGSTYAELIASMRANSPFVERTRRRHFGITEIGFRQEWSYQSTQSRCELLEAETVLELTIVLPEWADREGASEATVRRYQALYDDIVAHEERHAAIAREYLAKLREETDRPVTAPTCAALEAGLRARSATIIERHRRAQLAFDGIAPDGTPLEGGAPDTVEVPAAPDAG